MELFFTKGHQVEEGLASVQPKELIAPPEAVTPRGAKTLSSTQG